MSTSLLARQKELLAAETEHGGDYWCPTMVPGPLQTAVYARAVLSQADALDAAGAAEAVRIRGQRTRALQQGPAPRRFLLTRSGLAYSAVRGAAMVRQLAQIAELAGLQHVQVRVLQGDHPWQGPYTVRGTSVTIEGPAGRITLPGEHTTDYARHFGRLWEVARPFSGLYDQTLH